MMPPASVRCFRVVRRLKSCPPAVTLTLIFLMEASTPSKQALHVSRSAPLCSGLRRATITPRMACGKSLMLVSAIYFSFSSPALSLAWPGLGLGWGPPWVTYPGVTSAFFSPRSLPKTLSVSWTIEYIFAMAKLPVPRGGCAKKGGPENVRWVGFEPGSPARSQPCLPSEPSIPRCGSERQPIYNIRFLDTKVAFFPVPLAFFHLGLGRELQARFLSFGGGSLAPPFPFLSCREPLRFCWPFLF